MPRCVRLKLALFVILVAASALTVVSGCSYETTETLVLPGETPKHKAEATVEPAAGTAPTADATPSAETDQEKAAILDNVVRLIRAASLQPGGNHFGNATRNLNQYFEGTDPAAFELNTRAKEFLLTQLPPPPVNGLESAHWALPDARHLEDCMLYQGIATRIGGSGDDLTRVRRVFDWMIEQIQLAPPGRLAAPGLGQAQARPFDVLLRGLATEGEEGWSERGWLFLSLCRQMGLDAGLLTFTPRGVKSEVLWCAAVLIDKKAYLFDPRIGLAIPDARGDGVATLDEAMADPRILDRMDLHVASQPGYVTRGALLGSSSKIGVWLDSSLHYFSPRMKLLQERLAGKDLTILYRDPAEERDRFAEALGRRLGTVSFWNMPLLVETLLFTNPQFVESTKVSLALFRPDLPLIGARMKQLRGETAEAIQGYVTFRFAEHAMMADDQHPIPPDVQKALDVYATYFLGTCHLEQKHAQQAEFFFEKVLQMVPDPGPRRPYYYMFRWGAEYDLARLLEARGAMAPATAYYSIGVPTTQRLGNLLRARDLVWRDPLMLPAEPVPPAPEDSAPQGMVERGN